jgi:hypothetical protein
MDYSKKNGGTRVHDAMVARTLATGIGQTVNAAREHGSNRAAKVIAGIKPGQIGLDRAMKPHVDKRDADAQSMAEMRMERPTMSGAPQTEKWPLSSGSCSQKECGVAQDPMSTSNDQGEQWQVPTTGRHKRMAGLMQAPLRRAGK